MSGPERDRVRERLERWRALSPDERERVRRRIERFEAMPEAQQHRVRQGLERRMALGRRMRDLDEAGKAELARFLVQADPAQREALIGALVPDR